MTMVELAAYAPGFDFRRLLNSGGLASTDLVIVTTNTAFPRSPDIFDTTPLDTLKAWQAFHLTNSAATYLSKRFADARLGFYGKTLSGEPENKPRWKQAVGFVNGSLGESVGRMYVAKYFPPELKAKIDALVKDDCSHAQADRSPRLDGPGDQGQGAGKALELDHEDRLSGEVALLRPAHHERGRSLRNAKRTAVYDWNHRVAQLNQPVDKQEWGMTPQTVNAYYDPSNNEIVFPGLPAAAVFDPTADMAVNYGGIGAIIGHEITHGFDDQGRKYDGNGTLTIGGPPSVTLHKSQADRLAAQFDKFEPVKGYFVDGELTMGENIADLGRLLVALDVYHAALQGKEPPVLDGLTGDQCFFLAHAQSWRAKTRDEATIQQLKTDVHAPEQFRVNGPLRNIEDWYAAFKIGPDDPMYIAPENRARM